MDYPKQFLEDSLTAILTSNPLGREFVITLIVGGADVSQGPGTDAIAAQQGVMSDCYHMLVHCDCVVHADMYFKQSLEYFDEVNKAIIKVNLEVNNEVIESLFKLKNTSWIVFQFHGMYMYDDVFSFDKYPNLRANFPMGCGWDARFKCQDGSFPLIPEIVGAICRTPCNSVPRTASDYEVFFSTIKSGRSVYPLNDFVNRFHCAQIIRAINAYTFWYAATRSKDDYCVPTDIKLVYLLTCHEMLPTSSPYYGKVDKVVRDYHRIIGQGAHVPLERIEASLDWGHLGAAMGDLKRTLISMIGIDASWLD